MIRYYRVHGKFDVLGFLELSNDLIAYDSALWSIFTYFSSLFFVSWPIIWFSLNTLINFVSSCRALKALMNPLYAPCSASNNRQTQL